METGEDQRNHRGKGPDSRRPTRSATRIVPDVDKILVARIQDTENRMNEKEDSKLDIIQRPPKIYLDTNHLIYISDVRKGKKLPEGLSEKDYNRLDEYMKSCCGIIFNLAATLEWVEGNATENSASEIAAVVDSAKLKFLFEADYLVYTQEILEQCQKQNSDIQVPSLPIFQKLSDNCTFNSARGILVNKVPDYLKPNEIGQLEKKEGTPIEVQIVSVRQWVEETFKWKKKNLEIYRKRVDDFSSGFLDNIELKNEYFSNQQQYRKDWIKRFLKVKKILKALNAGVDADNILEQIDIKDCPAVNLYWTVREKRMRSGNPPKDNDVDDYGYIPVIPYADIVLIEKNLREFIFQADNNLKTKVFSKVSEALDALDSQTFTW